MKNFAKLLVATLAAASLMSAFATQVSADNTQTQTLEQEVKVNCTTGSYGQNTTCTAEGKQKGTQTQTLVAYRKDGTPIKIHKVANTSLPTVATAGLSMIALGSIAAGTVIAKRK